MVVVKWVDQTADKGGLLLAVDGQPDTSIGRKRFWEGTFLFANDVKSAGPGFKAFRPLARGADGSWSRSRTRRSVARPIRRTRSTPTNRRRCSADGFYARMGKLINPSGLDAEKAYRETLDALVEQLTVRVGSVDNGEKYQKEKGAGQTIPMPDGAKIFETTGPWEDYATPSRDMRLLIAMNVLLVAARADRQAPGALQPGRQEAGGRARRDREAAHQPDRRRAAIKYTRSDGIAVEADRRGHAGAARRRWRSPTTRTTASSSAGAPPRARRRRRPASATAARTEDEDGRVPRLVPRRPPPLALTRFEAAVLG